MKVAEQARARRAAKHCYVGLELLPHQIRAVRVVETPERQKIVTGWKRVELAVEVEYLGPQYCARLREILEGLGGGGRATRHWAVLVQERARLHSLELPKLDERRFLQAAEWALQREDSYTPEAMVVDFEREASGEANLDKVEATLIEREQVERLTAAFAAAGQRLDGVTLPIRAFRDAEPPKTGVSVLFHVGETMARIEVREAGQTLLLRGIPVGMEALLEAYAPLAGVTGRNAIEQKLADESFVEDGAALTAVRAVVDRLARQVERTVEYFQSNTGRYGSVEHVCICGPLAQNPGLLQLLGQSMRLPVVVVDPFAGANLEALNGEARQPVRAVYADAMAAALAGLNNGQNLLRPLAVRVTERATRRVAARVLLGFLIVATAMGGYYGYQLMGLHSLKGALRQTKQAYQRIDQPVDLQTVETQLARLAALRAPVADWMAAQLPTAVLGVLSKQTPAQIQLRALELLAPDTETGQQGMALTAEVAAVGDVAESMIQAYLFTLQNAGLFAGLKRVETNERGGVTDFQLVGTLALPSAASEDNGGTD